MIKVSDRRAEAIRAAIVEEVGTLDVLSVPRDALRAEAAQSEAYNLLNKASEAHDAAEAEKLEQQARRLFRESEMTAAAIAIALLEEQGVATANACAQHARSLRSQAKKENSFSRKLALLYTARALEQRVARSAMYAELGALIRAVRSGDVSEPQAKLLRGLVLAARGFYFRQRLEPSMLDMYGVERFGEIVPELAEAYRRVAGVLTDLNSGATGSAEYFDAEIRNTYRKTPRPRRYDDRLGPGGSD